MSMVIKVEGGTPPNRHLCKTCTNGQIIQGTEQGHYTTYCHYNREYGSKLVVLHQVSQCNRYAERDVDFHGDKALRDAYYLEKMPYSGLVIGLTYAQYWSHFRGELHKADKAGVEVVTPQGLLDRALVEAGRLPTVTGPLPRGTPTPVEEDEEEYGAGGGQ